MTKKNEVVSAAFPFSRRTGVARRHRYGGSVMLNTNSYNGKRRARVSGFNTTYSGSLSISLVHLDNGLPRPESRPNDLRVSKSSSEVIRSAPLKVECIRSGIKPSVAQGVHSGNNLSVIL